MSSADSGTKPGTVTYTGPVRIRRLDCDSTGSDVNFQVLRPRGQTLQGNTQYDGHGVPHSLPRDLEGKRFTMRFDTYGTGNVSLRTNDEEIRNTFGTSLGCDVDLQSRIVEFAASHDDTDVKEVSGTIIGQLVNPGLPPEEPSSCLGPEKSLDTTTAGSNSAEEARGPEPTPQMHDQDNSIKFSHAEATER